MWQMNRRSRLLALALAAASLAVAPAVMAAPATMVFEGFLNSTGGGPAADGQYNLLFGIYADQQGGQAEWTEGPVAVTVANGQFSYVLGTAQPIDAAKLAALQNAWLGVTIGNDPELPRQKLHSVAYARVAQWATGLSCSGCVGAEQLAAGAVTDAAVNFNYAASDSKGGAASDLACTGCVSVAEMNFDGDVDIGNNTLTAGAVNTGSIIATSVSATEFVGDGSKLTGISSPQGDCAAGTVVTGIKADGTITCGDVASSLPKDALDDVSNGVITNEFVDSFSPASMPIPIKDNFPVGTSATIVVPDVGLAKTMTVKLKLTNSDIADLQIYLFDPNNVEYTLYNKASSGGTFEATFPDPDLPEQGDLTTWYGKNLAGNWLLKVVDTKFLNNTDDGEITEFSVNINTVSNKKLDVKSLNVTGDLTTKGVTIDGDLNVNGTIAVNGSPWALMFPPGSRPFLYGFKEDRLDSSYQDAAWDYAYGHSVPIDNANLHRCCNEIRWGDAGGNIYQMRGGDNYGNGSSDDTQQVLVAFVKNTTDDPIQHTVHYRYTGNNSAGNHTGLGINKDNAWSTTSNTRSTNSTQLTFPANQTSTVVLKVGTYRWTSWNGNWTRSIIQYYNDSWTLPEGLEWDYERYYQYVANIDP